MKKAISIFLTDTHLKETNIDVNKSIFKQAISIAKSLGLSSIDHGGDIFHSRKGQLQVNLSAFVEILDNLKSEGIELNVCVGNHEKSEYSIPNSFLDPYKEHPSLNLYPTTGQRKLSKEVMLHYAAYFTDDIYINNINILKQIGEFSKHNILLTHIGCNSAQMNNGTIIQSSVTEALFDKWDKVLCGHYHCYQELAGGKVIYIGSSIQHDFSEKTGKGVTILYDDLSTEIIPLKYPEYIKYEINPKEITATDIEAIKAERQESGNNIRIVLTGSETDLKSFNKAVLIEAGVSVTHKAEEINKEVLENRVEAFDTLSLQKEFSLFCEKNKLDINTGMKYFKQIIAA